MIVESFFFSIKLNQNTFRGKDFRVADVRTTRISECGLRVSQKRAPEKRERSEGGLPKMKIKSQVGDIFREREVQMFKLGGQSYRHDPRRVVPVHKAFKHSELHSLIDTVTHLGGWRYEQRLDISKLSVL